MNIKNTMFVIGFCSFAMIGDISAMFLGKIRKFKKLDIAAKKRSIIININDPIKKYSVSRICDARDNKGNTPLHTLIHSFDQKSYNDETSYEKGYPILIALFKGYANPFLENKDGRTPRQEAELKNFTKLAQTLEMWEEAFYEDFGGK